MRQSLLLTLTPHLSLSSLRPEGSRMLITIHRRQFIDIFELQIWIRFYPNPRLFIVVLQNILSLLHLSDITYNNILGIYLYLFIYHEKDPNRT